MSNTTSSTSTPSSPARRRTTSRRSRGWTSGAVRARSKASSLALAALVALTAACGGGEDGIPDWLSQTYTDGKITIRYPEGWTSDDRSRFGASVGDARNENANAFVAVQYLPNRDYADGAEFGELARQLLRPPEGEGTRLLRTQAARIGGRRGFEAAVLYAVVPGAPLGPTLRVFGIELESGEVAILVFGAQDPASHRSEFAWIKRTITWN